MAKTPFEITCAAANSSICAAFGSGRFMAVALHYGEAASMHIAGLAPIQGRMHIESAFRSLRRRIDRIELRTQWHGGGDTCRVERGVYEHWQGGDLAATGAYLVVWEATADHWLIREDWLMSGIR